jgi:predicted transcriptional regulator
VAAARTLQMVLLFLSHLSYKNNIMTPKPAGHLHTHLTRRERQIMDILFRQGRATAADIMDALPGNTTYSTVRTQLRVLEEKGHVRHEDDGVRFVYMPAVARHTARKSALRHLVDTFFDGSPEKAVAALLGGEGTRLTDEQLDRIAGMIAKARKDGDT